MEFRSGEDCEDCCGMGVCFHKEVIVKKNSNPGCQFRVILLWISSCGMGFHFIHVICQKFQVFSIQNVADVTVLEGIKTLNELLTKCVLCRLHAHKTDPYSKHADYIPSCVS